MFPEPHKILEAVDELEFVMSAELFMTDMCRHSDIVLPVCTSFEREEFKVYPGRLCHLYQTGHRAALFRRPDSTIIKELADVLDLDDPLLRSGYENCVRWMLSDCALSLDDCIREDPGRSGCLTPGLMSRAPIPRGDTIPPPGNLNSIPPASSGTPLD